MLASVSFRRRCGKELRKSLEKTKLTMSSSASFMPMFKWALSSAGRTTRSLPLVAKIDEAILGMKRGVHIYFTRFCDSRRPSSEFRTRAMTNSPAEGVPPLCITHAARAKQRIADEQDELAESVEEKPQRFEICEQCRSNPQAADLG
jgi:hypothetical protein